MNAKRKLVLVAVAATCMSVAGLSHAGTAQDTMNVTATVQSNCSITAADLALGSYDPVDANKTANLDSTGSVSVTCTAGSNARIYMEDGDNFANGTRRASNGTDFLEYSLYTDAGRTDTWEDEAAGGSGASGGAPITNATGSPQTVNIYSRVHGGQNAPAGDYSDSVVVKIDF